jgi:hypothetical protein
LKRRFTGVEALKKRLFSYAFLMLAILCIIFGIAQGGHIDTLNRAATICLECVGIG